MSQDGKESSPSPISLNQEGNKNRVYGSSSRNADALFASLTAAQSNPFGVDDRRRERYDGADASELTVPNNSAKPTNIVQFNHNMLKESTVMVRTAHAFAKIVPKDSEYPVAVGYCLRGCGTHAHSNPMNRECKFNPSLKFKDNSYTITQVYSAPKDPQ